MRRHSDTLRAANAATKVGVTGRKRVKRKRLPVVFPSFFVVPRQNKDSRRDGGHAPPQRHLERSAATTKERLTGRKQPNEPREVRLLSSRLNLSSRRSPKEGVNGGENRISVANSVVFPSQKVTLSRQPFRFLRIHRWHRSSASEQRRPLRERCTAFRPLRNR